MTDQDIPPFNLLDEPWLRCLMRAPDGKAQPRPADLGLKEIVEHAHEVVELTSPSPLITISLYRLLLAIMHRVFGPTDDDAWWDLWDAEKADVARLNAYLDTVRPRFNLFDKEKPFYQVKIDEEYAGSIAKLTHEHANTGNAVLLFDHGRGADAGGLSPAEAARYLVAFQAYAVGGLISYEKGLDPKIYKSASAGPLVKGAVVLVRGANLWQTLLLNLVQYPRDEQDDDDAPAWERGANDPTTAKPRRPKGYLDYVTWQSRRVCLFPTRTPEGNVVVRRVAAMKGHPFGEGFERRHEETMVAFSYNEKAKPDEGQEVYPPLVFRDERALWRDSMTIFAAGGDKQPRRPQTLQWLDDLRVPHKLGLSALPLDALGMRSDQAKVLAWHHERLPLPLAYLDATDEHSKALFSELRTALTLAENAGRALRDSTRALAKLLIAPDADDKNARQPLPADVNGLAQSLGVERIYWAALDEPFARFLVALPLAQRPKEDRASYDVRFKDHVGAELDRWADALDMAGRTAFESVTGGLDGSARALKAAALGARARRAYMGKALSPYGAQRRRALSQQQLPPTGTR